PWRPDPNRPRPRVSAPDARRVLRPNDLHDVTDDGGDHETDGADHQREGDPEVPDLGEQHGDDPRGGGGPGRHSDAGSTTTRPRRSVLRGDGPGDAFTQTLGNRVVAAVADHQAQLGLEV